MDKILKLYKYVDGGINDTPFPNSDNPIEIGAFRYDAKRMGGAPTITASVNYPSCLDDEWTDNVYAEFNGEKYYLKQTPTSSYNNESTMYKHDLELISERSILDNVYFFDAVVGDSQGDDKPVSNSTKVVFFGNVREFVARLNASLAYSHIDYEVEVDNDENITTEERLMSFEDQFFSNVLQEIYNTYEVPYYFVGKTIHIGFAKEDVVIPTLGYGVDDALLSITKNNANYKVVNRATGIGSSENIPFYYPNNSPKGDIEAIVNRSGVGVTIKDYEKFANEVGLDEVIRYSAVPQVTITKVLDKNGNNFFNGSTRYRECDWMGFNDEFTIYINSDKEANILLTIAPVSQFGAKQSDGSFTGAIYTVLTKVFVDGKQVGNGDDAIEMKVMVGETIVKAYVNYRFDHTQSSYVFVGNSGISYSVETLDTYAWYLGERRVDPYKLGLEVEGVSNLRDGDTITQRLVKYVKTSQNLMPSVYRYSDSAERFYNAVNYPYPKPEGFEDTLLNGYYGEDGILRNPLGEYEVEGYIHNDAYKNEDGTYIHFNAPYVDGRPKEHIITVEDIKPTITGTKVNGLRIDMFSEFAYDDDDNDETYEDEDGNVYFKHPYFYGKLRIMDFNLFDHAIEQQPMTISFTSGNCGACNFEIGVTEEYPQKNPVQVDENGNLVRDENGMIVAGVEGTQQQVTTFQDRQQDTSKYEVWIALRKEEATYGILMPQVAHRPKADTTGENKGDTFVILGINLPKSYILNEEKKLEAEIIKYIKDNNDEKFSFSIGFSRIYFEENDILDQLSENSKIRILYDNKPYDLYVSSFSYSMSEGDVLPEIRVELDDTLKVSQNALQNAISQVKSELGRALGSIDVVGTATPYFIRKDADDEARGRINFTKGIKFGEGGKVEVMDNNSAKLTIEYLEVTKKASFTSLEIQEKTHVGGQILVTPAAINCGEVEELDNAYRCYFQTKGADGDEIFNQFAVGDQAICQTFNAWGSKYYWRLVTGIGEDYIDLSKVEGEYDEDSDAPSAGDKIIQLGNQVDEARQNAIVIAAYGDGSPYIIQYKGINAFELPEDKIVTKLSSTENIFTGIVHIKEGSDGFGELGDFAEIIQETVRGVEVGGQNMLRNSGFTGDYLSAQLADEVVLDAADKMFNPPLVHWDGSVNVEVIEEPQSTSGYAVKWSNSGVLIQPLYQKTLASENYIFSFRAKGVATMTARMGGVMGTIELDSANEFKRYVYPFVATKTVNTFLLTLSDEVIMCEPQLERGTIATSWSNSYLDNSSERAYYQAGVYVQQALHEGSTTIGGGLVLTNHIKVGNYANQEMIEETGGMQGTWTNDDDVFIWGGGNLEEAINAIEEKGDNEANFVVTHGGKAILNDAIVRGIIYTRGGEFYGKINVDAPNVDGRISLDDDGLKYYGKRDDDTEYLRVSLGGTCQGASLVACAPNGMSAFCTNAAILAIGDENTTAVHARGNILCYDGALQVQKIVSPFGNFSDDIEVASPVYFLKDVTMGGTVNGLRTKTRVISNSGSASSRIELSGLDCSVLVNITSGTCYMTLPEAPQDGQEYWIETKGANIDLTSSKPMWSHWYENTVNNYTFTDRGVIRFKYYEGAAQWTYTWVEYH